MQMPSFPQLQLTPEQVGFKKGDFVTWCGVAGKVLYIKKGKLYVGFTNRLIHTFFLDGRYQSWHTESSLKPLKDESNAI